MSASFKSYSRTNKLALFSRRRSCPTYSQLVAMVGWAAHSNRRRRRRRRAAVRLTVEAVGIGLSVRPSVRPLGVWMRRASRPLRVCRRPQLTSPAGSLGMSPAYLSRPKQRWSGRPISFQGLFQSRRCVKVKLILTRQTTFGFHFVLLGSVEAVKLKVNPQSSSF